MIHIKISYTFVTYMNCSSKAQGIRTHVGYVHFHYIMCPLELSALSSVFPWLCMHVTAWFTRDSNEFTEISSYSHESIPVAKKSIPNASRQKHEASWRMLPFSRGDALCNMTLCKAIMSMSHDNDHPTGLRLVIWVNHHVAKGPYVV